MKARSLFHPLFLLVLFLLRKNVSQALVPVPETVTYGRFGKVMIYPAEKTIVKTVICFAGDGGWNKEIENIALKLKSPNTLIIGVNTKSFLHRLNISREKTLYPAADVEELSQFIQKQQQGATYVQPVLLGYSSGASLVYGLLAQAPEGTFAGGIVLGFCPDLAIARPLAQGSGSFSCYKRSGKRAGYDIGPCKTLSAPMISLQGKLDQVCDYASTYAFLNPIKGAQIITLPDVGHGYGVEKNWMPQLERAYAGITEKENVSVPAFDNGLPLTFTPAKKDNGDVMVIFLSGDGGWTGFDQEVATAFAEKGVPVIGVNSLKYFWNVKTPLQTTHDVLAILEHYATLWHKNRFILAGYSFGADVVPFVYNRLVPALQERVVSVGLLSPAKTTDFEIHLSDMLLMGSDDHNYAVIPEIARMQHSHTICFYGQDETDTAEKNLPKNSCKVVMLPGGHHYDQASQKIVEELVYPAMTAQ
ncbi:MAG: virulence factor family protein [Mucilaginibacter polytrichastri]|nr:virulence factor family protein [Mucilaginibacter polytrichastri]